MPTSFRIALCMLLFSAAGTLHAQALAQAQPLRLDLAATYTAERSLKANTSQNFWLQGGSIQLGADVYRGWGIAADVTGTHAGSIGASGIPLSLVTETFGPRYRWHADRKWSAYGEGLIGDANAFHTVIPSSSGAQVSGNSMAIQVGGGVDYSVSHRVSVRLLDAAWLRTQFSNATDNVQNNVRLGAGIVVRFGH